MVMTEVIMGVGVLMAGGCFGVTQTMICGLCERFFLSSVCVFFVSDGGIDSTFFDLSSWVDKIVAPV
jgi:hypothetical protein